MLYQHEQKECILMKKKKNSIFAVVMLPDRAVRPQSSNFDVTPHPPLPLECVLCSSILLI